MVALLSPYKSLLHKAASKKGDNAIEIGNKLPIESMQAMVTPHLMDAPNPHENIA